MIKRLGTTPQCHCLSWHNTASARLSTVIWPWRHAGPYVALQSSPHREHYAFLKGLTILATNLVLRSLDPDGGASRA